MKEKLAKTINKENFKKVLAFLKKLPWFVSDHVFTFLLATILLGIIISAAFSFRYLVLSQRREVAVPDQPFFEEDKLRTILKSWREGQERFDSTDNKDYPDLFVPKGD